MAPTGKPDGGRARVRAVLIALRTRLGARGRTHRQAPVAYAPRILIYAGTVLTRGTPCRAAGQPG